VTAKELERIRRWWNGYVRRFDEGDADIRRNMRLKESHTLRVRREGLVVGKALGLSEADLRIVDALVLLHDVGRFVQYARYRTFADYKSENHALLSLKIMRQERVLWHLDSRTRSIVQRAIRYHNQAAIPPVKDRRLVFFAQLLRDADKLDIWRLVIDYYYAPPTRKNHAISIGIPDTAGVTPGVLDDVRAQKIVASKNIHNLNDFKLLQMGWVFDINFIPTLLAVRRRSYLEKIRNVLPRGEEFEEMYCIVKQYVDSRIAAGK
jgi:hypothetical protein